MKKFDFLQLFIVVILVTFSVIVVVSGVHPSVLLSRSGTVVGKVCDKWTGYRVWAPDSFVRVATDKGGMVTVSVGDQFNYVHPGFRYELEISEGRVVASKQLPD